MPGMQYIYVYILSPINNCPMNGRDSFRESYHKVLTKRNSSLLVHVQCQVMHYHKAIVFNSYLRKFFFYVWLHTTYLTHSPVGAVCLLVFLSEDQWLYRPFLLCFSVSLLGYTPVCHCPDMWHPKVIPQLSQLPLHPHPEVPGWTGLSLFYFKQVYFYYKRPNFIKFFYSLHNDLVN